VDPKLIKDMNQNPVVAVQNGSAMQAWRSTADATKPTLETFLLDMNASTATLGFSETVVASTLDPTKFVIQKAATAGGVFKRLTGGSKVQRDETTVVITLLNEDMNDVKATSNMATAAANSYVRADAAAVQDTNKNALNLVADGSAIKASGFVEDSTSPTLESFELNLDDGFGSLTLSFSETVAGARFTPGALTLQSVLGSSGTRRALHANASLAAIHDSPVLKVMLTETDANVVKNINSLCADEDSTFISITTAMIADVNNNSVSAIAAASSLRVSNYTADSTSPSLTSFTIDLTTNKIVVNFNEPVDKNTFEPRNATIQATVGGIAGTSVALTGGTSTISTDGMQITLTLLDNDVNGLTAATDLANSPSDTYLRITAGLVKDTAGNKVQASSTKAHSVTDDSVAPTLASWELDMTAETATLNFNESMDSSKVDVTAIVLQDASSSAVGAQHQLTSGSKVKFTTPSLSPVVLLSLSDMNSMKLKGIGASQSSSYLAMRAGALKDMNGLNATALTNGVNARGAAVWTRDTTPPEITGFDIDLDKATAVIRFSEIIKGATFDATKIILQSDNHTQQSCPCSLCLKNEWTAANCTEIGIGNVLDTDCRRCTECPIGEYETAPCTATRDSNCTACEVCPVGTYLESFCQGVTPTVCKNCTDGNATSCSGAGAMTTACKAGSVLQGGVCKAACDGGFYTKATASGDVCATCHATCATCSGPGDKECTSCLDVNTMSKNGNGAIAPAHACTKQLNCAVGSIKDPFSSQCASCDPACLDCFGSTSSSCLTCNSSSLTPVLSGSTCVAVCPTGTYNNGGECDPCSHSCDTCVDATTCTSCSLASAAFLEDGVCFQLSLHEANRSLSTLVPTPQVVYSVGNSTRGLTNCTETSIEEYTFTQNTVTASANGVVVEVNISKTDLDAVKWLSKLATSRLSTFMAAGSSAIKDMANNYLKPLNGSAVCPICVLCDCPIESVAVSSFDDDATDPELESVALNMDGTSSVTLSFSETVNGGSFNSSQFKVQSMKVSGGGTETHTFGAGQVEQTFGDRFTFYPAVGSLNALKALRALAISDSSSFFSVTASAVSDFSGNKVVAIAPSGALKTNNFTADVTDPVLTNFDLDMNRGVLKLVFDEVVDAATLQVKWLTLLENRTSAGTSYSLQGGLHEKVDGTELVVNLTVADMNAIKQKPRLAVSNSSSYLRIAAPSVNDTVGNPVAAIGVSSAVAVTHFVQDTTPPVLESFDLNMHSGHVALTFTETVDASKIQIAFFSLQSSSAGGTAISLAGSLGATTDSTDITIKLSDGTLNEVKRQSTLGTYRDNTFITMNSTAVTDMAGVAVVPILASAAKQVASLTNDRAAATVTGIALDMHALELVLNFTETMNASSLDVAQISLQNKQSAATQHVVLTNSKSVSQDGLQIVIKLSVADGNSIKSADSLATLSVANVFLAASNTSVRDMGGNGLATISESLAQQVDVFKKDSKDPTLDSFELNMNALTVTLLFSETVRADSMNVSAITLQSGLSSDGAGSPFLNRGNHSFRLTGGNVTDANINTLVVYLTTSDANAIKALPALCTSPRDAFLVIEAAAVEDMRGNELERVADGSALNSTKFTKDVTPPRLIDVQALMLTSKPPVLLVAEFSESVVLSSLNVSAFVLQEVKNISAGTGASFRFRSGVASVAASKPTVVSITVWDKDLAAIKHLAGVGRTQGNTFFSLDADAIKDHAGNGVSSVSNTAALQVSNHTIDITPPQLVSFDADFHTGELQLTFSETVVTSTFNVTHVVLQASNMTAAVSYQLTVGIVTTGIRNDIVVITLNDTDIDPIKKNRALAVGNSSTFISLAEGAVFDAAENAMVPVPTSSALQVSTYTKDKQGPRLVSFTLNMTDGSMVFTFDEVAMAASLDVSSAVLQNERVKAGSTKQSQPLAGVVTSGDGLVITANLNLTSANALRAAPSLAVSLGTTFLVISPSFISDVDGNGVNAIADSSALQTAGFGKDTKAPAPVGFSIDLDAGRLVLTFTQPVNGSSVADMSKLKLQAASNSSTNGVSLTGGSASTAISTAVTVTFSPFDLNVLKRSSTCAKRTATSGCFVTFSSGFIADATGLAVAAVVATDALPALDYKQDSTSPETVVTPRNTFDFDLNKGQLKLTFTEVIEIASFKPSGLTLVDYFLAARKDASKQFTNGSIIETVDSTTLTVQMAQGDLNAVKANKRLCTRRQDCYLQLDNTSFADFAGNALKATAHDNLISADVFVDDTTPPELLRYTLDMSNATMVLSFTEAVDPGTLVRSGITLLREKDSTAFVQLSPCVDDVACSPSTIGTLIEIAIASEDMNQIKLKRFALNGSDVVMSISSKVIKDMAEDSNSVKLINATSALSVIGYTRDAKAPKVSKFRFDLDQGKIVLSFNEPVNPLSLNTSAVLLQGASNASAAGVSSIRLQGDVEETTSASMTVTIALKPLTQVSIKADSGVGTSKADTFLSFEAGTVSDVSGNAIDAVLRTTAVQASDHTKDETPAKLQSFVLDLAKRELQLTFTDVIDKDTFAANYVQVVPDQGSGTEFYQLTGGTIADVNSDSVLVTISLSISDFVAIGEQSGLGTSVNDTYLSMTADAFDDTSGRDVISVTRSKAQQAAKFVPDTVPPTITGSTLDLSANTLVFNFSEPINMSSFDPAAITLQSHATRNAGSEYRTITSTVFNATSTRESVTVWLEDGDTNAIKVAETLAVNQASVYIVAADSLVADLSGVKLQAINATGAQQLSTLIADSVAPTLISYGIDMDAGFMNMTFSEVVKASSIIPSLLTLQDSASASVSHTLSQGQLTSTANAVIMQLNLTVQDINALKTAALATSITDTYLRFAAGMIKDMGGNNVTARLDMSTALRADSFHDDATPPTLKEFSLNMNAGTITLSFSESMAPSSVKMHGIGLQSGANLTAGGSSFTFTDGDVATTKVSTSITVNLTNADMNILRADPGLAVSNTTTFLTLKGHAITDVTGNNVTAVTSEAARAVSMFVIDTTPPTLLAFTLDTDSAVMTMSFSETVQGTSFDPSFIALLSASNGTSLGTNVRNLTGGTNVTAVRAANLSFVLLKTDIDALKVVDSFATAESNTFVSIASALVSDMSNSPVVAIALNSALQASLVSSDITEPAVTSFTFDLNAGLIRLKISEPLAEPVFVTEVALASSGDPSGYTLHNSSNASLLDGQRLVEISISTADLNAIKSRASLAVNKASTILAISSAFAKDKAGFAITPLYLANGTVPTTFGPDLTSPKLVRSTFDLSAEQLHLTFSETVNGASFNATGITFVGASTSDTFTLTGGDAATVPSTIITVNITHSDMNSIKGDLGIGSQVFNTHIAISNITVADMNAIPNSVTPIPVENALAASKVSPDKVAPAIIEFDLNLDLLKLVLRFTEPVNARSFAVSTLSLVPTASSSQGAGITLGSGNRTLVNSTSITTFFGDADGDRIKNAATLCTRQSNCFLLLTNKTVTDMSRNAIASPAQALRVSSFIQDTTAPGVTGFAIDMDSGRITLNFTEAVNVSSLSPSLLGFASSGTGSALVTIGSGASVFGTDVNTLVVTLPNVTTLNELKLLTSLATSSADTYLVVNDSAILDMNNRPIAKQVIQANKFTNDGTDPTLTDFEVDMTLGRIKLYFSEVVRVSSFNASYLTLQSKATPSTNYTLTGGKSSTANGLWLAFAIEVADLNQLKALEDLCVTKNSTFLSVRAGAVKDMANNGLATVSGSAAKEADQFVDDLRAGSLVQVALDMDAGTMVLEFNETMNYASLDTSKITLQNTSSGGATLSVSKVFASAKEDALKIYFNLTKADVDAIKLNRYLCTAGSAGADCFVSINGSVISDQAGRNVIAIPGSNAQAMRVYTQDATNPALVALNAFQFDINTGKASVRFVEPVDLNSVILPQFALQETANQTAVAASVPLGGSGSLAPTITADGKTIKFELTVGELNAIKRETVLAANAASTVLRIAQGAVKDMAGNPINETLTSSSAYTEDTTDPTVVAFSNMTFASVTSIFIVFDETIDASTLNTTTITLQSNKTSDNAHEYTLKQSSGFNVAASSFNRVTHGTTTVEVALGASDVDAIKIKAICLAADSCFVRLTNLTISDMAGRSVVPVEDGAAKQVQSFVPDTIEPQLTEFTSLDYDAATLTMKFDEPVEPGSLNYSAIRLDDTDEDPFTLFFTDGASTAIPSRIIVVNITATDLNSLKRDENDICKSQRGTTCYLTTYPSLIKDVFGNHLKSRGALRIVNQGVALDTKGPVLQNAQLDMESNSLTLVFDEPVDSDTLRSSQITLQSSTSNATGALTLQAVDSNSISTDKLTITFTLTEADVIRIKANEKLATGLFDAHLSFESSMVKDLVEGNPNLKVATSSALAVSGYTADSTSPSFAQFVSADPNSGTLQLSFSEPVNATSLNFAGITLQSDVAGTAKHTLAEPLSSVAPTDTSTKLIVELVIAAADLAAIQLKDGLMRSKSNTYVALGNGTIADMAGKLLAITNGAAARQAAFFAPKDRTQLLDFDLNMNNGTLKLSFDSAVDAATLDLERFTLQGAAAKTTAGIQHATLTSSSTTNSSSGTQIIIDVGAADLNAIKAQRSLATNASTTFASFTTELIKDTEAKFISAVAESSGEPVHTYVPDTTPPTMLPFKINMTDGTMTIYFDEMCDLDTFEVKLLTLKSSNSARRARRAGQAYTLTGGTYKPAGPSMFVVVSFTQFDLNSLNLLSPLCESASNCFLDPGSGVVQDMSGQHLIHTGPHIAVETGGFAEDTQAPVASAFELDMNSGTLTVNFTETINVSSFTPTGVTLQDNSTATSAFQLTGGNVTGERATFVVVDLTTKDLNVLKADLKVAADKGSTWMTLAHGAVQDTRGNDCLAIFDGFAIQASEYTQDTTRPQLIAYSLNMNAGKIIATFSETVDADSFDVKSVALQSEKVRGSTTTTHYLVNTSALLNKTDSPVLTIHLGADDLNALKNDAALATKKSNLFLAASSSTVADVDNNTLIAISATGGLEVTELTPDTTGPIISQFAIDLAKSTLTMVFNEPVDGDSLKADNLILLSNNVVSASLVQKKLQGGFPVTSADGLQVTLNMLSSDVNDITLETSLATNRSNTFLSLTVGAVNDTSGNPSFSLAINQAKNAVSFGQDTVAPRLQGYSLSMNASTLTLFYNETMQTASFKPTYVTLQSSSNASAANQLTLSASSTTVSSPGTTVGITLSPGDMDELKRLSIANTEARTYLTVLEGAIQDMNGRNSTAQINAISALEPDSWAGDKLSPTVIAVNVSMEAGEISFAFSETVRASTFDATRLTVQGSATGSKACPCAKCLASEFKVSDCNTVNDTVCSVCDTCAIGEYESSPCTALAGSVCTACGTCASGTYLESYCRGTSPSVCKPCSDSDCSQCAGPGTGMCMQCGNGKFLHEGICMSTCPVRGTYADTADMTCKHCHPACKACSGPATTSCTTCEGQWGQDSDNSCKNPIGLNSNFYQPIGGGAKECHSACNECFDDAADECISCPTGELLIRDFSTGARTCNTSCPLGSYLDNTATQARCMDCPASCTHCTSSGCTVCEADFILETGACTLTTTAVQKANLTAMNNTQITYPVGNSTRGDQTCFEVGIPEYNLTIGSKAVSADGTGLVVKLSEGDIKTLKARVDIALSKTSTYIAFASDMVADMTSNAVVERSGRPKCPTFCWGLCSCPTNSLAVSAFEADSGMPTLFKYDLSLDGSGALTLTFSEPINISSVNPSAFTLQSVENAVVNAEESVSFAGTPAVVNVSTVVITPTIGTLNAIKAKRTLAIGRASTFLTFPQGAVRDNSNNPVVAKPRNAAEKVNRYTPDTTPPELISYDLDMNGGVITLVYSEPVDAASVNPKQIAVLANASNGTSSFTFTNANVSDVDSTTITCSLFRNDMDAIKRFYPLATSKESTFLKLTAASANDTAGVAVIARTSSTALGVSLFKGDKTAPRITAFDLDMTAKALTLRFSETVNMSSLDTSKLTLLGSDTLSNFTIGQATFSSSADSAVTVTLNDADMNAIKSLDGLANSKANTQLSVGAGAVQDFAGNKLLHAKSLAVELFKGDIVRPALDWFTLDMNATVMTLRFTEVVNSSTFDVTKLTLQHNAQRQNVQSRTLTSASTIRGRGRLSDTIVVDLSAVDANAIKASWALAVEDTSSVFLTAHNTTVRDTTGNLLTSIADGSAKQAATFIADRNKPELESFSLNMDGGVLGLTFTETVNGSSLNITQFTLVNEQIGVPLANRSFKLTGGLFEAGYAISFDVNLTAVDMNEIKARIELCSRENNTFIAMGASAVKDMSQNANAKLACSAALAVAPSTYTKDTTAPRLMSFDALMPTGKPPIVLRMYFSETVSMPSLDLSGMVLQDSANRSSNDAFGSNSGATSYTGARKLFSGVATRSATFTQIQVTLSDKDYQAIVDLRGVMQFANTTFVAVKNFVADEAGNAVVAIAESVAEPVSVHTVDVVPPALDTVDIDLGQTVGAKPKLLLGYAEPILIQTFNVTQLTLTSAPSSTVSFKLTGGNASIDSSGKAVSVDLTAADVHSLKRLAGLAVNRTTTYLSAGAGYVQDTALNFADEITLAAPKAIRYYQGDQVDPVLNSFTVNMTDGTIMLTFNEVMDAASFDFSRAKLQSSATSPLRVSPSLDAAAFVGSENGRVVGFTLTADSANSIRALPPLGVAKSSTFFVFDTMFGKDVNGNTPVKITTGVVASDVTRDSVPPSALGFTIEMTSGQINITYEQPVNTTTLDPTVFELRSKTGAVAFSITGGTVTDAFSTVATLVLSESDLSNVKRLALCDELLGKLDCNMNFGNGSVVDTSGNGIIGLAASDTIKATRYVKDSDRPAVITSGFSSFDLNSGIIILNYSEPVDRATLNSSKVSLTNMWDNKDDATHRISLDENAVIVSAANTASVAFELSTADLNLVKSDKQLCTSHGNCFIQVAGGSIADMSGNPAQKTDRNDLSWAPFSFPTNFVEDTTAVKLLKFGLNMKLKTVTLTFDEIVDKGSLNQTALVLRESRAATAKEHRLGIGSVLRGGSELEVTIVMRDADVNAIKTLSICISAANTYLAADRTTITDIATSPNSMTPVSKASAMPVDAASFVADDDAPKLVSFSFNEGDERLVLAFNEPVVPSSLNVSLLTLLSHNNGNAQNYTLTTASVVEIALNATLSLTLQLVEVDIAVLKTSSAIAGEAASTFLKVGEGAVADVSGIVIASTTLQGSLVEDVTLAQLTSFVLDLQRRQLSLLFDEIMNPSRILVSGIAFQNVDGRSGAATSSYGLTNSKANTTANSRSVVLDISDDDFIGLGLELGLATTPENTFITISASTIDDVFDRDVVAKANTNALKASSVVSDTQPPRLKSSTLDMTTMVLSFVFTEAINKTTFVRNGIKIQSSSSGTGSNYSIPDASTVVFAADLQSCTIKIDSEMEDSLKKDTSIATSQGNTFLSFSNLASDLAGNVMPNSVASSAMQITIFKQDLKAPKLLAFGVNVLDGCLELNFSEVMNASSTNVSKFAIQNVENYTEADSSSP
jgi:hypothetical protein